MRLASDEMQEGLRVSEPEYWVGVELRKPPDPTPPAPNWIDTLAKTLAGGYVFVAFILTLIAGLQGGLERLLINHPWWTVAGLLAAGGGITLAFVDAYLIHAKAGADTATAGRGAGTASARKYGIWKLKAPLPDLLRIGLILLALLLFGFGLGVLITLSTKSVSESERPAITTTASLTADSSKLEGHVAAFGVQSSQWIYVSVNGFTSGSKNTTETPKALLYQTRAGPNRSGKVDLSFNIPVSFGRFAFVRIGATRVSNRQEETIDPCFVDTEVTKEKQSCATVYPPEGPTRPTLSASWDKGDNANVFTVAVKTTGVDPDSVVLLTVSNGTGGSGGIVYYRSVFSGSATGAVDASAKVQVPKTEHKVCVVASAVSAVDTATLKNQAQAPSCDLESFDLSRSSFALFDNLR